MSRKRASIDDVATAAGVSAATVSRALRGFSNVAPSTRERIEAAARELRYRADPAASRLARGRGSTVVIVIAMLDGWYFPSVMAGAEAVLAAEGYELAIFVTGEGAKHERLLSSSTLRGADGVILVDVALGREDLEALLATHGPTVTVGLEFEAVSGVVVDDVRIGHEATTHLLSLGHSAIALVGGSADNRWGFSVPDSRRQGYLEAHAHAGVPVRPELEVDGNFSLSGGYEEITRLLQLKQPPTAVFAMSDEMAFGALKAARDRGLRVPEDFSVVGVDDHPLAWVEDLTTINQQVCEHGAVAAQMVVDRIEGRTTTVHRHELEAKLIVRGSTAPARQPTG